MPRRPEGPAAREQDAFDSWAGRQPLVSGEEAVEAARLYSAEGWSVRRLADEWKVSYNAMHGTLKREGVKFRRPGRQPAARRGPEGTQ